MENKSHLLFVHPSTNTYKHYLSIKNVIRNYSNLLTKLNFHKNSFSCNCSSFTNKERIEIRICTKYLQTEDFFIKGYFFNPAILKNDCSAQLPDLNILNIIKLNSKFNLEEYIENLKNIYVENKWEIFQYKGELNKFYFNNINEYIGSKKDLDPNKLYHEAITNKNINYNKNKLYFKKQLINKLK